MGCSNTKSSTVIEDSQAPVKPKPMETPKATQEYPASEAYTIPLDNDESQQLGETLRQPPKRIQQLMQQAADTEPLSLEELEEKQQRAEQRRQELMQQKVEQIQKNTQMLMGGERERGEESQLQLPE